MARLVPSSLNYLFDYTVKCFRTNPDYIDEDIEWMLIHFNSVYIEYIKDISKLYSMLALVNISSFCGYFSLKYNNLLTKYVKERDASNFKRTILNPVFYEVSENTYLKTEEKKELNTVLILESMVANFTVKRMITTRNRDSEKLYIESYNEIYEKLFSDTVSSSKVNFQEFILITEFNAKSGNSHAYTYRLVDILTQCINNSFTYEISQSNINLIKERFNLELKIVEYALK
jgi:hypothetical protein